MDFKLLYVEYGASNSKVKALNKSTRQLFDNIEILR